jgi:hypothetical protein
MTRDERYLIFTKIDENYDRNKGCYSGDWSDEKVAKDFNVPRIWVSTIRDDSFGPDTNEQVALIIEEAKTIYANIQEATPKVNDLVRELTSLSAKADKMMSMLQNLENRK